MFPHLPMKRFLGLLLGLMLATPAAAIEIGQSAPELSLPALVAGEAISLRAHRGKVVYLDFWASWCEPCRESMPVLDELQKRYGKEGFVIVGVNLDMETEWATRFLEKRPVSYLLATDPEGQSPQLYGVEKMPSAFFIDRKGKIREIHQGFRKEMVPRIRHVIEALLKEGA